MLYAGFGQILLAQTDVSEAAVAGYTHDQKQELADHALHILGGNANVISRWTEDIRLALIADESAEVSQHVSELVSELASITGLQGRVLNTPSVKPSNYLSRLQATGPYDFSLCENEAHNQTDCANLVVVIANVDLMRELATAIPLREVYQRSVRDASPYCFFAPFVNGMMTIKQAFVYIRDDLDMAMKRTCLQEEIYQSFGLFNDASGSTWFSFNNKVEPKSITAMDKLLLKTVYSKQFGPGMPAYVVVRTFLKEVDKLAEK